MAELDKLEARGHWGIKCGLDNVKRLLERLGNPQARPVVLIAGTNGKGSTGAFLARALRAAGLKVGWTTSPHLVSPTERIWLDGAYLSEAALADCLARVFAAEAELGLQATYFELMIASAFLAFRDAGTDLALVEVGMGGRWDATNASEPILTVLTNVAIDHTAYLGPDRASIAREKLCTARQGRPLVLGPALSPAWVWPLLECRPELFPAPPLAAEALAWDHSRVAGHRIPLAGGHQLDNLATAWEAIRGLQRLGFPIQDGDAWRGIETTRWPGRLWTAPGLEDVVMDGAHNLDGTRTLAAHARATGVHPHLLFSAMGDKDLSGMVRELKSMEPASVTLVRGDNPRYATAETLRQVWGSGQEVLDIAEAAARLRQPSAGGPRSAGPRDAGPRIAGPRLVCGSLYFIGDLLRELQIKPQF